MDSPHEAAIVARGLGVRYDLELTQTRTLRRSLATVVGSRLDASAGGEFWALRNVDFAVETGEILGVIGSNGAGKSTLMLAIAGIISPDEGALQVHGRRPTLLTLGAGFERELTGRENIRLNGAYLGLSRKEIDRLIDPIGEFSELGEFLDVPIKKYSSGMRVRLGFSIAVHTNPEVLLLDEVLSVGDAAFQEKSRTRMLEIMSRARAIVIVSHSAQFIERTCSKVLWLEKGGVRGFGEPGAVVGSYRQFVVEAANHAQIAARPQPAIPTT